LIDSRKAAWGSEEQIAELGEGGGARFHGGVSGNTKDPDRFDRSGGVLGLTGRLSCQHFAGRGFGVDRIILAFVSAGMSARSVDFYDGDALGAQMSRVSPAA
jgi:hypothetical protein